jgi:hypothetical protein
MALLVKPHTSKNGASDISEAFQRTQDIRSEVHHRKHGKISEAFDFPAVSAVKELRRQRHEYHRITGDRAREAAERLIRSVCQRPLDIRILILFGWGRISHTGRRCSTMNYLEILRQNFRFENIINVDDFGVRTSAHEVGCMKL